MTAGMHEGQKLFQDKGPVTAWQPSRVKCCRFVRDNYHQLSCEEALALFPHIKETVVRQWYERLRTGQGMGNGRDPDKVYDDKPKRNPRKRARRDSDNGRSYGRSLSPSVSPMSS